MANHTRPKELSLDTAESLCLVGRSFLSLMKRCEERRVKARPTRYQVSGLRKKALREISLLRVWDGTPVPHRGLQESNALVSPQVVVFLPNDDGSLSEVSSEHVYDEVTFQ